MKFKRKIFSISYSVLIQIIIILLLVQGTHTIYFAQESFYLQGILDDINEQGTSFLDCKYKHMMKSGAPPDKFIVLYCMVTYRIPWCHKQK